MAVFIKTQLNLCSFQLLANAKKKMAKEIKKKHAKHDGFSQTVPSNKLWKTTQLSSKSFSN